MAHQHSDKVSENPSEKKLIATMVLNFLITAVEIVGGIISGSLSLLSDAIHNFSDGIAIIISYAAVRLSRQPRTPKHTFGLKRAEILAAVVNASTLIIISFFLIKEAIGRFSAPTHITGGLMLTVAAIGFAANVVGTFLLKQGASGNINIRSAYLHLISDAISSLAVVLGAVFIMILDITWIDPVLTILISLYILKETYDIVRESVGVIMMATPGEIDVRELQEAIEAISGVRNIHHLHIWRLNDADIHFEAHIEVDDVPVSKTAEIRSHIQQYLHDRFYISHTTLQFECDSCSRKELVA